MKYYAYYRVSTQTQVEENGIGMQLDVISKYLKKNSIVLSGEFKDEGISGTELNRPGLLDLLSTLETGDKVIVQNTSRLWRNEYATAIIKKQIRDIGADVVSIEQPRYTVFETDPNEMFMNSMFELLDRYDKAQISLKLAKGRRAKANTGYKPCGNVPYGYQWIDKEIKIDQDRCNAVISIFNNYITFKSLEKLRNYCIREGYTTIHGNDFSKQALKNILTNDFYVGVLTYAGKKIDGNHPAIVDEKVFKQVNAILSR